jgi:hydroxyacylglutathione hydrolase
VDSTDYKIDCIRNLLFPSNSYIVSNAVSGESVVIDPGLSSELIHEYLHNNHLKPIGVLVTHGHFDHIAGVSGLVNEFQIPYYLHEADLKLSKSANFYLKMAKINKPFSISQPTHFFTGYESNVCLNSFDFQVYNFPGHSPGSCVLYFKSLRSAFTGDIFYKKGLGFNNFPGEDKRILKDSIVALFNLLPADTAVFAGHGEPTTVEEIKTQNVELQTFLNTSSHA